MTYAPLPATVEAVARRCIDCGLHVHRELGPGFKERIYHRAFALELDARNIKFECEKPILVRYKEWTIPGQKIDLLIEGCVMIELKSVPRLRKIYTNQVLSYLQTADLRLGLIMNFNTRLFRDGLKRVIL